MAKNNQKIEDLFTIKGKDIENVNIDEVLKSDDGESDEQPKLVNLDTLFGKINIEKTNKRVSEVDNYKSVRNHENINHIRKSKGLINEDYLQDLIGSAVNKVIDKHIDRIINEVTRMIAATTLAQTAQSTEQIEQIETKTEIE